MENNNEFIERRNAAAIWVTGQIGLYAFTYGKDLTGQDIQELVKKLIGEEAYEAVLADFKSTWPM